MNNLTIVLHHDLKRLHAIVLVALLAVVAALVYLFMTRVPGHEFTAWLTAAFVFVFPALGVLRDHNIGKLFIRIDDTHIAWRLMREFRNRQRIRPPISKADLTWDAIEHVGDVPTGMYIGVRGGTERRYLPLSNFSFAQRKDIKDAITARLGGLGMEHSTHIVKIQEDTTFDDTGSIQVSANAVHPDQTSAGMEKRGGAV